MSPGRTDSFLPGRLLLHPVALAALLLWMVNDHVFKALWPGHLVVGKLSDVASLIAFPLLVAAGVEWAAFLARRRVKVFPILVGASLATAFVMATINVFPAAAHAYEVGLGALQWPFFAARAAWDGGALPGIRPVRLWMDATDLLTLPAAAVPVWLGWRARPKDAVGVDSNTRYAHAP